MLNFFAEYGSVFELILSFSVFVYALKPRHGFIWRLILGIFALFAAYFIKNIVPEYDVLTKSLKYAFVYATCTAAVLLMFEITFQDALFVVIAASLTQHCAYKVSYLLRFFLAGKLDVWAMETIYVLSTVAVNVLIYCLLARQLFKGKNSNFARSWLVLLLSGAMLIVCVVFQQLFETYFLQASSEIIIIFSFFDLICCAFVLFILYAVFRTNEISHDYHLLEQMLHMQKDQMNISKEAIELINVKCHDLKKLVKNISIKKNMTAEELDELNNAISAYSVSLKTGNEALDVLLAEKMIIGNRKEVQFNCIADGSKLSFMRASDIYSLFGNAIDNAIDAVASISDAGKRCIGVAIKESKGLVSAHFENYYERSLDFAGDNLFYTTKKDKNYHGYGLKSMKLITERYGGFMSIKADNGVFTLDILIPIP